MVNQNTDEQVAGSAGVNTVRRTRDEAGSTIVLGMLVVVVMSTILVALVALASATTAESRSNDEEYAAQVSAQAQLTRVATEVVTGSRLRADDGTPLFFTKARVAALGSSAGDCYSALAIATPQQEQYQGGLTRTDGTPLGRALDTRVTCEVVPPPSGSSYDTDETPGQAGTPGTPATPDLTAKPPEYDTEGGNASDEAHPLYAVQLTGAWDDAFTVLRYGLSGTSVPVVKGGVRLNSSMVNQAYNSLCNGTCTKNNPASAWVNGWTLGTGNCFLCTLPKDSNGLSVQYADDGGKNLKSGGTVVLTKDPVSSCPAKPANVTVAAAGGWKCFPNTAAVPDWRPFKPLASEPRCLNNSDSDPYDGCTFGVFYPDNRVKYFEPGTYLRRPDLSDYGGYKYAWFKPGVYDFRAGLSINRYPGGLGSPFAGVAIGRDLPVVAGTRSSSISNSGSRRDVMRLAPTSRCVVEADGVQFLFYGSATAKAVFEPGPGELAMLEGQLAACPITRFQAKNAIEQAKRPGQTTTNGKPDYRLQMDLSDLTSLEAAKPGITIYQVPEGYTPYIGAQLNSAPPARANRGLFVASATGFGSWEWNDLLSRYSSQFWVSGTIFMPGGAAQLNSVGCKPPILSFLCTLTGVGVVGANSPSVSFGRGIIAAAMRVEQSAYSFTGTIPPFSQFPVLKNPGQPEGPGSPGTLGTPGRRHVPATKKRVLELAAAVQRPDGTWVQREKLVMTCVWTDGLPQNAYDSSTTKKPDNSSCQATNRVTTR